MSPSEPVAQIDSIGNYLILEKLGADGTGRVFKAQDLRLGRIVAMKLLPTSFGKSGAAVPLLKRHLEAVRRLKHPNLVTVLEAEEDRGVHFLVMEYVEGRDLAQVVRRRGPISVCEAIDWLIQAARGLEAAHARGIVHRDIKPAHLMLDQEGTVRVLNLGLGSIVDASKPIEDTAPEQAEGSHLDDIYGLGCTLYYFMTGREPFSGEVMTDRPTNPQEPPAPSLRAARPDAPSALERAFQEMMARRPDSMTAVIAMLESCRTSAAPGTAPVAETPKPSPGPLASDKAAKKPSAPARSGRDAPIRAGSTRPAPTIPRAVRSPVPLTEEPPASRAKPIPRIALPAMVLAVGVLALLGATFVRFVLVPGPPESRFDRLPSSIGDATEADGGRKPDEPAPLKADRPLVAQTIFDGKSGKGWMLTNRKPLPPDRIQPDGLNPHATGSYLVVHEKKLGDFVLDLDYKLTKGCNTGVFLRVGNLADPVNTGIEVAIDDSTGTSYVDPGAFYDLVAPVENAQKPAGQWNHMTITAAGPVLAVSLNGKAVSRINLDEWSVTGKRPDGTDHKFQKRPLAELPRTGYIGFQDHGRDCWFKNITLKTPSTPAA